MRHIRYTRKRLLGAFTLIELLVVVSIIALLLSILMPSLNKARQVAKRVICASNVRQMGLGLQIYAENHNSVLPPRYAEDSFPYYSYMAYYKKDTSTGPPLQLADLVETGCADPRMFYCPSFDPKNELKMTYEYYTSAGLWGKSLPRGETWVRVTYNYWLHGKTKLSELDNKPLVVDLLHHWFWIAHRTSSAQPQGVNALFSDGRAEFKSNKNIFDETLWDVEDGQVVGDGPGMNTENFVEILRRIEQ